jgi:uncharacterized protein (DUF1330 family)
MAAYIIADTKVHDAEGYERYKALARPIAESYGGNYLARGGELTVDDDDLWTPTRMVIIEFPDADAARAFMQSDEYAPVRELRHRYADSTVVLVDGA